MGEAPDNSLNMAFQRAFGCSYTLSETCKKNTKNIFLRGQNNNKKNFTGTLVNQRTLEKHLEQHAINMKHFYKALT